MTTPKLPLDFPVDPLNVVILYHANCTDGLGAKYAAWRKFGDKAQYLPVAYGNPLPNLVHPDQLAVFIIDFSYPAEVLVDLASKVKFIQVLDHHKTAQDQLKDLPFAYFNMKKSGAVLAWEYFHTTPVPRLLNHIQDRDIWTWEMASTREVLAGLSVVPDLENMEHFHVAAESPGLLTRDGTAICKYMDKEINRSSDARQISIKSHYRGRPYRYAAVNCTHLTSEVGNALVVKHSLDFALLYSVNQDGTLTLSFRSVGDFDVAALAQEFGGGGHKNAAGASKVPLSFLVEELYLDL